MNFTQQYYNDLEKAILGNTTPSPTSDPDRVDIMPTKSATSGMSTPAAATAPTKTATVKTGAGSAAGAKSGNIDDHSTTYALNLILPEKTDPSNPDAPLTDDEKKKRAVYIMVGLLAAIIILIIALSMRKK